MIYYQKTMVAINKPEEGSFIWYWLSDGIKTNKKDTYSEKEYIWSDEKLEDFQYQINEDEFLEQVRANKSRPFSIKKTLFDRKEYLEHKRESCVDTEYEMWWLDEIKRVDAKFCYVEQHMNINEARKRLDVEEYAKMVKSLGLKEV